MYTPTKQELQKLIEEKDIIAKYFQIQIEHYDEKSAHCSMPLTDRHRNPLGIAHGGAIFSLADMCFVTACHASGRFCVNSQTSLSFLNKGVGDKLHAKATLLKGGSKMVVYQIAVTDCQNTLVAQGQITGYCLGSVEELITDEPVSESRENNQ